MAQIQAVQNYAIFFDDVRVDDLVKNWNVNISCNGSIGVANLEMLHFQQIAYDYEEAGLTASSNDIKDMLGIIDNMTNVKIFVQNIFSDKYQLVFDGNIRGVNKSKSHSSGNSLSFQAVDYMNYTNRAIAPIVIPYNVATHPSDKFIWEAQGIDVSKVLTIAQRDMLNFKGKSIKEILSLIITQALSANKIFSDRAGVAYWDGIWDRMDLMADINKDILEKGVADYIIEPEASNIDTIYVLLSQILQKLIFEFYQDRDGIIRIKPPFWSQPVLKSHVIDSNLIMDFSENTNYENYLTRTIITGGLDENFQTGNQLSDYLWTPIGCYLSNGTWVTAQPYEGYEYGWGVPATEASPETPEGDGDNPIDSDAGDWGQIYAKTNDKINYSYAGTSLKNSSKSGTISGGTVKLKAFFTAYSPRAEEGGVKDRFSRWLDPDTATVAILASVASKYNLHKDAPVLIEGTGKAGLDGRIYYYRDTGTVPKDGYDVTVDVLVHSPQEIRAHWKNYSGYITLPTEGQHISPPNGTSSTRISSISELVDISIDKDFDNSLNAVGVRYKNKDGSPIVGFADSVGTKPSASEKGVGVWFPNVETGIKAHIQLLSTIRRNYILSENKCVNPYCLEIVHSAETVMGVGVSLNRNRLYCEKLMRLVNEFNKVDKKFKDVEDMQIGCEDEEQYNKKVNDFFINNLRNFFMSRMFGKRYIIDREDINFIFDTYIKECRKELIYPDVALSQMVVDTGWLCWGGKQSYKQNNFARIGDIKGTEYTSAGDWYWSNIKKG